MPAYFDHEIAAMSLNLLYEQYKETWHHRIIVETEEEAERLVEDLENVGHSDADFSYDDDSSNFDVTFTTGNKLEKYEIDEILDIAQNWCNYQFNVDGY